MALPRPIKLSPRPSGLARLVSRKNLPTAALAAVALVLAGLIVRDAFFPPSSTTPAGLRTATASMGTVTNSVTATGTLVPAQQVTLGFKTAGTLTAVDVHVGDHVKSGQLLATIDPSPLQVALQQAQATLASAQATLSNTLSGTSLTQAQHALDQANQNYTDAVNAANATNAADQAAAGADQTTVNGDLAQVNADKANYWYTQYAPTLQTFQTQLTAAQIQYQADGCNAYTTYAALSPCSNDAIAIQNAQSGINCLQTGTGATCTVAEQQIAAAYKTFTADNGRYSADVAKVQADNAKTNADSASGQRSIQQAQNSVTNAQDAYNGQAVNRPATIQQQQAQVASASALVDTAQANLTAATLDAPLDGVVTNITAQAGDSVTPATASSGAEAPGTTAPLPSSGAATGSTGGGSTGFMTLMSDKAFQAVVSFAESDAAKVASGQTGTVTFDAISDLTIPIHVLAVAGSSTVTSNVVNYYVTITLDSLDDRLKAGLTTNATVITARAANVLVVPNAAVTHRGTLATVTLLQGGKEVVTQVETGIAGTSNTEISSGLKVGDTVVLPTTTTRTTTTTGGGRFGGGGGGGGGLGLGG